ncbi:MAG: serine/threonine protein kinase [Planctomycetaceae bacterium]|nr:serine/threonine protein kinase [Planctomycetaceae bacterium]
MRNASTLVILLLCSAAFRATLADDWVEFRGPTGQGHAQASGLPVHWTETKNVTWRQAIPGKGWSSPIVSKGRVYLTTAVPVGDEGSATQSLRAVCLNARTGTIDWDIEVFEQPSGAQLHQKNSHASATPITDGQRVYVHFGTHGTAALDLDGHVLWRNHELKYSPQHGNGGSPVLVDGLLVVSCDGTDLQFVAALDQASGQLRWKRPRSTQPEKGFSFGTPLVIDVGGRKQLISAGSDAVFAYDPADGSEIWKVNYPGGFSVVPRPVFGEGLLFICTGYNVPSLLAIRPEGASGDVTESHVAWKVKKGVPANPSPLLVGQALYLVSDGGVATCLDATTGQEHWNHRVGGNYSASPVHAGGKIYAQSEEGEGVVFQSDPGRYVEVDRNTLGERALASYAISDGALFLRSAGHLARVETARKN